VICRLVPSINRELSASVALNLIQEILDHPHDWVIGIGMDYTESKGPPAQFTEAYYLAGEGGLYRTAHVCEDNQSLEQAPPQNVIICLEDLGCDRLDHGYNLLSNPAVVERCREAQIPFTCCSHTSNRAGQHQRLLNIQGMLNAGLKVTLNTDDPAMFGVNLNQVYTTVCLGLNLGVEQAVALCLNGVEAAWLGDQERDHLRQSFLTEINSLRSEIVESDQAVPK
jgi:adenosine deaminase